MITYTKCIRMYGDFIIRDKNRIPPLVPSYLLGLKVTSHVYAGQSFCVGSLKEVH